MCYSVIDLNTYKEKSRNEELRIKNIMNYLQIKLLEEIYYKTDMEINRLYDKLDDLPGIKCIMRIGGRKNLDFYFYDLYLKKLIEQVILPEKNERIVNERIECMRSTMLNNLIIKYLPKEKKLINNNEFKTKFFYEVEKSILFNMDKSTIIDFFEYRNEVTEFGQTDDEKPITICNTNKKIINKCPEIKDNVLGMIRFCEKKNIYLCDYIGDYCNFTIKIISNEKEETERMLPLIEKAVENIEELIDIMRMELIDNQNSEGESKEETDLYKQIYDITSSISNLLSIVIWPDGKIVLIYSVINKVNDESRLETAILAMEQLDEQLKALNLV